MALTTLSGVVSGIRHSSVTEGHIGKNGGTIRTGQTLAFRINDQSVQIKLPDMPDVQDGEQVTVAGRMKNGRFHALALRNDSTRAVYGTPATLGYIMGVLMVVLGFMLLVVLIGVLFLGVGGYTLYQAYNYSEAVKLLRT
ncbi:MAG: hypothetical protein ABS87_11675 [Sphingomonas sp. SCN 67-18]|uniref:hypothetical protein n=1 Tax=uncultured Sphingomonas sp. TaxID=158754 RepID=UPI0008696F91|nr:hypothetical protein [Sphingomonas sp. SCN 67-18]ODU20191.1 MAG: hypothetical protein ABS87_11675 [Sphingomonas sp. SCN 67-18]